MQRVGKLCMKHECHEASSELLVAKPSRFTVVSKEAAIWRGANSDRWVAGSVQPAAGTLHKKKKTLCGLVLLSKLSLCLTTLLPK